MRVKNKSLGRRLPVPLAIICAVIICVGVFVRGWMDENNVSPAGTLQVHVIDAGNADASLVICGSFSMLIDAGESGDSDELIAYIQRQGINRLNYVIATHPHADHIGGMSAIIDKFKPETFIMPFLPEQATPTTNVYLNMLNALIDNGISVTEPEPGMSFSLGEARIEILGPALETSDENNISVICRVQNGSHRFLFTGDAEAVAEKALLDTGRNIKADVLKVGHHGSKGSSLDDFLDAVSPAYAVIPCSEKNSYGHPHEETLARLRLRGITVFRSDINGHVVFVSDGNEMKITTQR